MRITGGQKRGTKLKAPKGLSVRPAPDRVRIALFNILGPRVEEARVLDLYAGTGSLGLEALSRGAAFVVFVDASGRSLHFAHENLVHIGFEKRARLVRARAERFVEAGLSKDEPFDIAFLDPPFKLAQRVTADSPMFALVERIADAGLVSRGGRVIIRFPKDAEVVEEWPSFELVTRRHYGASGVVILTPRMEGST